MRTAPLHVFWVEDSTDDIDLFVLALQRAEVRIKLEVKQDGEAALDHLMGLDQARTNYPDLILLDLNLPKKHGSEILTEIKKAEHLQTVPVVIFTTSSAEPDIVSAYRLGASCYLIKPNGFDRLVGFVRAFCIFWEQVETVPRG